MTTPSPSTPGPGSGAGQGATAPAAGAPPKKKRTRKQKDSPHDMLFRQLLGEPANAASQLREILPGELVARLDLDKLAPAPGTLVDSKLGIRHTDVLFTVPLDQRPAFVYVLMEHQSSSDWFMALRLLRYIVMIWERYLADNRHAVLLPAVIPVVVHHNRREWSAPTELFDLIDVGARGVAGFEDYLPRFRFVLDDLAGVSEETLRKRDLTPAARMALVLLKITAESKALTADLRPWMDELLAVLEGAGRDSFEALVRYIETVTDARAGTQHEELRALFAELGPEAEEVYVTIAEMLAAQGEARGLAKGRAEGRVEGRADTLVDLLVLKFGPLPENTLQTVRGGTTDQLATWTARILTAESLDDVLR